MDLFVRGTVIFVVLFIVMRIAGNRQFAEMTAFDAVLIIVIAEVTGNALSGNDYSLTAAIVVIATLLGWNILVSVVKIRWKAFDHVAEGRPVLLVENGRLLRDAMKKERIDVGDILSSARELQGLESIDQVKFAVLETNGTITIIPRSSAS